MNSLRRFNNTILKVLSIFLVLTLMNITSAFAERQLNTMKVKVGYPHFEGINESAEDGTRSGYGYDFLQMLAPLASFEYEYIGSNRPWRELVQMLEKGEIDILFPVHRSDDYASSMDFSAYNIGNSSVVLTTYNPELKYIAGNPKTFDGIRIGIIHSSSCASSIRDYANDFGFRYTIKEYINPDALFNALKAGEIDASATRDLRSLRLGETILARFANEPFYVATKKGDPVLLVRINQAIARLDIDDPEWRTDVYSMNYHATSAAGGFALTAEESSYMNRLSNEEPIKVIFNPDREPYAYVENGKTKGIFFDIFADMADRFDLKYEIIPVKHTDEYNKAIDAGLAEIIFDCPMPFNLAEQRGYNLTQSYCSGTFAELHRKNEVNPKTVAAKNGALGMTPVYQKMYNGKTLIEYPSLEDCVNAVRKGEADCAYMYVYTAANFVSQDVTATLDYIPVLGAGTSFRIAVKRGMDPELFSIMNKYAGSITDNTIQTLVASHRKPQPSSVKAFIYHHPLGFISVVLILAAMAAFLHLSHVNRRKERRASKLISEAYQIADKANHAKSEFLASISHDMRTPMNTIVGMNNIAIHNIGDKKKVADCLSKIDVSANHLMELINNVLDISVIEAGEMKFSEEPVDIVELMEDCRMILSSQAHKKDVSIILDENKMPKTRHVISSPLPLRQIILNIASNGIKFNNPGGTLELRCEENHVSDDISEFIFTFKDNGIGMSQDYLEHLFEPFSHEDDDSQLSFRGAGLGLPIVKKIVEAMAGTIKVESEKGAGSTFTVSLPLRVDKTRQVTDSSRQSKEVADIQGVRVLIVDDNELNLEIEKYALESIGAVVTTAQSACEALGILAENGIAYDVVLMDLMMPEMDGFQATKAIRDSGSMIPVIAITANAFDEDRAKALAMGMNGFISKPIDKDAVIREISKFCKA